MSDDVYSGSLLGPSLPAHLYIHVPFCASKCAYCDFASISGASDDVVRAVFTGIRTQLRRWEVTGLGGVLDTVYVGGGTPSRYPEEVIRVLDYVREHFVVRSDAEVTVEANPDSVDAEVAAAFASAGVTRVSVGVQSFDDTVLRVLGRRHDARAAWDACRVVSDAGMDLSVDLICGVPGQTITSWSETLARAAATGARHASVYPLSIEPGTAVARRDWRRHARGARLRRGRRDDDSRRDDTASVLAQPLRGRELRRRPRSRVASQHAPTGRDANTSAWVRALTACSTRRTAQVVGLVRDGG